MSNQSGQFNSSNFGKIYTPSPRNPIFIYALITLILVIVAFALYLVFGHYSTGFITLLGNIIGIIIASRLKPASFERLLKPCRTFR